MKEVVFITVLTAHFLVTCIFYDPFWPFIEGRAKEATELRLPLCEDAKQETFGNCQGSIAF